MHYVYLLKSETFANERYVGLTSDLKQRIEEHNSGKSPHTSKFRPWKLVTYVAFSDRQNAKSFERYPKSGSGHAFARKRFWWHFDNRVSCLSNTSFRWRSQKARNASEFRDQIRTIELHGARQTTTPAIHSLDRGNSEESLCGQGHVGAHVTADRLPHCRQMHSKN